MKDRIHIRAAQPRECRLLSELAFRSKAYWGYSDEFMEAARAELTVSERDVTGERVSFWIAEYKERVVGFIALAQVVNDACRLESLFVEPDCIGKGVGRLLVEFAKSYAKDSGARALHLQSDPNAMPFYLAVGGVQVGESESDSIAGRFLPEIRILVE